MSNCYFELRKQSKLGNIHLAADMMRHLHTRQYLGKAVVVCEHPAIFMIGAHKQWLRLSRNIQRQRASTIDADKILKYTHAITYMQHTKFVAKTPLDEPAADVYFLRHSQLQTLPTSCFSLYLSVGLPSEVAMHTLGQLPSEALLVDYQQAADWQKLNLTPKRVLEDAVAEAWQHTTNFLANYDISVPHLFHGPMQNIHAMDNALDTLLAHSHGFLQVADQFRHALELSRPLRLSKNMRQEYDILTLLAHRVQALSSSGYTQRFLETYNEDDTFFLYDNTRKYLRYTALAGESLATAIARHQKAGRLNLAQALQQLAQTPRKQTKPQLFGL